MTDWPLLALRPAARGFVITVPVTAAAAMATAAALTTVRPAILAKFCALLVCGLASVEATRRIDEPQGTMVRDLLTVWCLPIAVLLPPFWVLAAPVPLLAFTQWRVHRGVVHRRVFSAAAVSLAYGSASAVFHALPASVSGNSPGLAGHAIRWAVAVAGCDLVARGINNTVIAAVIKISDPAMSMSAAIFGREAIFGDFVQFCLGVVVTVVTAVNPALLVFAAPSVLLQRRFMMHAQLVSRTRTDPKTGLLNAAAWERQADAEVARAVRTAAPIAIALLDIDHFKAVNDTYGHLAGDDVLRAIAATFRHDLRGDDAAGRFGGDEFAILLPETARNGAHGIAERLRADIAELTTPLGGGPAGRGIQVTVSIGVAAFDGNGALILSALLTAADAALYQAKRDGRNQVRVVTDITAAITAVAEGAGTGPSNGHGTARATDVTAYPGAAASAATGRPAPRGKNPPDPRAAAFVHGDP